MIVLLPSRGRPQKIKSVLDSFHDTKESRETKIIVVLSQDDPKIKDYYARNLEAPLFISYGENLTQKLNQAAGWYWHRTNILGFVGDDNIFRTKGWDLRIEEVLKEPGIAYGNDLYQGAGLPTSVFISTIISKTLGWFSFPGSEHMYLDNAWKVLGEKIGRLIYLPDVVIEHLHPVVGKSEWDETYALSNTGDRLSKDREAFFAWEKEGAQIDANKVKEAI